MPKAKIKGINKINIKAIKTGSIPTVGLNLLHINKMMKKGIRSKYQRKLFRKSNNISFISFHINNPLFIYNIKNM